jgi:hypothetical protein
VKEWNVLGEQEYIKFKITQKGKKWILLPSLPLNKKLFKIPLTIIVNKEMLPDCVVNQKKIKANSFPNESFFDFDLNGSEILVKKRM